VKNVAILVSGRGSNMVALLGAMERGEVPGRCVLVVSNVPGAPALEEAGRRGIPTVVLPHGDFPTREDHDSAILARLMEAQVDVVCLAGYMRLLSPILIHAFRNRLLNIHPALLPAFPGLHVQRKAVEHGVRFSGCTVHLVDEEVDHGPIVLQAVVPLWPGDDEAALSARILKFEHRLYPAALKLVCEEKCVVEGRRVRLLISDEEYRNLLRTLMDTGETR
jgi:phosphoribosylglycinamide formyltransferase-1